MAIDDEDNTMVIEESNERCTFFRNDDAFYQDPGRAMIGYENFKKQDIHWNCNCTTREWQCWRIFVKCGTKQDLEACYFDKCLRTQLFKKNENCLRLIKQCLRMKIVAFNFNSSSIKRRPSAPSMPPQPQRLTTWRKESVCACLQSIARATTSSSTLQTQPISRHPEKNPAKSKRKFFSLSNPWLLFVSVRPTTIHLGWVSLLTAFSVHPTHLAHLKTIFTRGKTLPLKPTHLPKKYQKKT